MTESQRPPISPPPAPGPRVPPPPPPPMRPAANTASVGATQQMSPQTMPMPTATTPQNPAPPPVAPPPSPSGPPAGHPPGAPPSAPNAARKTNTGAPTLEQLVREAFDKGFSDVHLGVGETPRFRNRGEIDTTNYPVTDEATFMGWLREILTDEEIRRFQDTLDFDGASQYDFARIRINIFDSLHGPALVLRLIPVKILTMEELSLPPVFR